MSLIIPDQSKPSTEDYVWALPVPRDKWQKWFELSKKFKTTAPPEFGGVRYVHRMEGGQVKTIIMLPGDAQSDDDVTHSAAWLRMIKQLTCRIYVLRCDHTVTEPLTGARLINAVAGMDPSLMETMEVDTPDDDESESA